MIIDVSANLILSLIDFFIPDYLMNLSISNNPVIDVLGYGYFCFGSSPFRLISVLILFFSVKFVIGVFQWVWDRLPLT